MGTQGRWADPRAGERACAHRNSSETHECAVVRHTSLHYRAGYSWLQQAAVAQHVTSFGFTCDAAAGTTSRSSAVVIGVSEAGRGAACVCMSGDAGALGGPMGGRASVCASVGNSSETHECAAVRHASQLALPGRLQLAAAGSNHSTPPPSTAHTHTRMYDILWSHLDCRPGHFLLVVVLVVVVGRR